MKFKRMLKFTLSALLLAGSVSAYAQEGEAPKVVTLSDTDGTKVTWAEFVKAINNPGNLTVNVSDADMKEKEEVYNLLVRQRTDTVTKVENTKKAYDKAQNDLSLWTTNLSMAQAKLTLLNTNLGKKNSEIVDKNGELANKREELNGYKNTTNMETDEWLAKSYVNAAAFAKAFGNYLDFEGEDKDYTPTGKIYYKREKVGKVYRLYISFVDSKPEGYAEADEVEFWHYLNDENPTVPNTFSQLYVYFNNTQTDEDEDLNNGLLKVQSYGGTKDGIPGNAKSQIAALINTGKFDKDKDAEIKATLTAEISQLQKDIEKLTNDRTEINKNISDKETEINNLNKSISEYTTVQTGSTKTKLTLLSEEYQATQANLTKLDEDIKVKKEDWDKAVAKYNEDVAAAQTGALTYYKNVTLTGDVTADAAIKDFDGKIVGGGHVITLSQGVTHLFERFTGTLINVAVNGGLAQATSGVFNSVASWSNGQGEYYDPKANHTENLSLGALGFKVRDLFAVDFTENNNRLISKTTDTPMVYNITVYTYTDAEKQESHFVQLKDSKFINDKNAEIKIPVNTFVKSETTDLKGVANVFYNDNTCEKVVITDRETFYCPVDITAENVVLYDKNGNNLTVSGKRALCLPFDMKYGYVNATNAPAETTGIKALCRYDKETSDKFWFKREAEFIPANTPFLLVANEEITLSNLMDVTIRKTEKQLIMDEGAVDEPSKCYGLLKQATNESFAEGASGAYKIYALSVSKGTFNRVESNVSLPAFRAVIYSAIAEKTGVMAAPRSIGILDEKGIEITDFLTGVESVETEEVSSLGVVSGRGEIRFTSDADYGKVEIYTLDGKVAAVADVMAGTTTVNVQEGLYIVMGKKVLVK